MYSTVGILNTALGLIVISEPIGILPIIYRVSNYELSKIKLISRASSLTYLITMLLFCWFGRELLSAIGITIHSFKIAGGLILLPVGLKLIEGISPTLNLEENNIYAFAHIPIGVPLLAGPAAISLVIIEDGSNIETKAILSIVIALISVLIYLVFNSSLFLKRFINERLLDTINRFTGMLLVSIAVQMIISGIKAVIS